jgi:hypothetical protein
MNKKFWIAFIVVFIMWNVLDFLIHGVLLASTYMAEDVMKVMRPDMMSKMWIFYVVSFIQSFFLALIYSKWQKGKGIAEGVQFGVYSGLLMATPMAYSSYAMYPLPYGLVLQWFLYGMVQFIILGIILSAIFGKKAAEAAPA